LLVLVRGEEEEEEEGEEAAAAAAVLVRMGVQGGLWRAAKIIFRRS
jgi:hypothetical protein